MCSVQCCIKILISRGHGCSPGRMITCPPYSRSLNYPEATDKRIFIEVTPLDLFYERREFSNFQKKVTTNFLTGQESPGILSFRPREASPVICYCASLITHEEKGKDILMHASQSGKCVCSAFVLAAGLHLSSELGFWESCAALNCSSSVKKDVGLGFAHVLDTAYIQLWVIAVDPKT